MWVPCELCVCLAPTFNSCGKCSQNFHFHVLLSLFLPTVCWLFPLSLPHTHAGTWCTHTSGLIFIASSSSFTWHGSLNRCAAALSCLPPFPPLSSASCFTDLPYLLVWKKQTNWQLICPHNLNFIHKIWPITHHWLYQPKMYTHLVTIYILAVLHHLHSIYIYTAKQILYGNIMRLSLNRA